MIMKKKKTLAVISAILLLAIIGGAALWVTIDNDLKQIGRLEIKDVDLSDVGDGTYFGSHSALMISAEVKVTVENHKIAAVEIVKHNNGKGAAAEAITEDVVNSGSIEVDTIAGATYSSKVILKAIQNALTSAKSN